MNRRVTVRAVLKYLVKKNQITGKKTNYDLDEENELNAFPGHGKARDQELARLRRELKKVTEERDFLKDAARYFAKESK